MVSVGKPLQETSNSFDLLLHYILPFVTRACPLHEFPVHNQYAAALWIEAFDGLLAHPQCEVLVALWTCNLGSWSLRTREVVFVAVRTSSNHRDEVRAELWVYCISGCLTRYALPWSFDLFLKGEIDLVAYLPIRQLTFRSYTLHC